MALKPTLRRNGKHEITVQVTHYLTRHDVAVILALWLDGEGDELPTSRAVVDREVRDHLRAYGWDRIDWYLDRIEEEEVKEAEEHLKEHFNWPDDV